jgi:hypothetical protein
MSDMTWKDLRDLDCAAIRNIGESWKSYVPMMIEQTERLRNDVISGHLSAENFESHTSTQVREHIDLSTGRFEDDLSDYANIRVATTLLEAADALEAEQKELEEVVRLIEDHDFKIEGDKHNYDVNFSADLHQAILTTNPPEWLCHRIGIEKPEGLDAIDRLRALGNGIDLAWEASDVAREYQDWLCAIMSRAHDADDDAAAALSAMRENPPELPPRFGATYDDLIDDYKTALSEEVAAEMEAIANGESDMSPEQVNQWWENLSDTEREALLSEHPEWVGPTDGIPVDIRDTANRVVLDDRIESIDGEIASIEEQMAQMVEDGTDTVGSGRGTTPNPEYAALTEQWQKLQSDKAGLSSLQDRITDDQGNPELSDTTDQPYYLMGFGTEGSGQAIVSIGNPDEAANVNTYVPGTGAGLGNVGNDLDRADIMALDAHDADPANATATVLWVDYDAPDDPFNEARDMKWAEDGSDELESFTQGIRATAEGEPSNLTLTGHSYGTDVVGTAAASEGVDVDNIVFVASPGTNTESAHSLGIEESNVYATTNDQDIIGAPAYLGVNGPDPTDPDYGATVIESEAVDYAWYDQYNEAMDNHGTYWGDQNLKARTEMAQIVAGLK